MQCNVTKTVIYYVLRILVANYYKVNQVNTKSSNCCLMNVWIRRPPMKAPRSKFDEEVLSVGSATAYSDNGSTFFSSSSNKFCSEGLIIAWTLKKFNPFEFSCTGPNIPSLF